MKLLGRFLLWGGVFLALLAAFDQLLVRLPPEAGLGGVREFYVDFRGRLGRLLTGEKLSPAPKASAAPAVGDTTEKPDGAESGPRYIYVDGEGQLHFAETLEEIPAPFRSQAQPLGQ